MFVLEYTHYMLSGDQKLKTATFKNLLAKILMIPVLCCLNGCVYLVVGGVGALGGYVVSPDTVEGLTENDKLAVWDSAVEILSVMGTIQDQSEDAGTLVAKVSGSKITITVSSLNDTTTKLSVKSRKSFLPKISTAQDVFVKIMSDLNE